MTNEAWGPWLAAQADQESDAWARRRGETSTGMDQHAAKMLESLAPLSGCAAQMLELWLEYEQSRAAILAETYWFGVRAEHDA